MYSATLLMFLSMPLIPGSIPSFIITLTYLPLIHKRMNNEEKLLAEDLDGYQEYMQKVKYRLIPYVY
jgi:protein-S-isoprenylcysteine O-methyltransferase Ste14